MKKFFAKNKTMILKISIRASRIKALLNVERINSEYLSNQYSIAFNPNLCGILIYKLVTSKDTKFKFFVKFLLHFLRKSKSSFT